MNDRKDKPEQKQKSGGPDRAEAGADEEVNLDDIDRFLKEGLDAVPVEKVSGDSLRAQIVTPLDVAPAEAKPSEAEPAPEASAQKPEAGLEPGPATLLFHEGFGDMEVRIPADRMTASLAVFEPRRQDVSVEEVVAVLKANRIVFGIDERAVQTALRAAAKRGKVALNVIIARGVPVVEGQDAQFLLECLEDKSEEGGSAPELTADILGEMEKVRKAFQDGIESLGEKSLKAVRVMPGECILRKIPPQAGTKGTTILGVENLPKSAQDVTLKTGPNVRLSDDKLHFHAEAFGYLVVSQKQMSVIPPIFLPKDRMTACFINLPPIGPPRPIPEVHLRETIARMGIQHGIDEQTIARLCAGDIQERAVVIARGADPVGGADGQTHMKVEVAAQPGKVLEDGTIDFKERNAVANVPAGDLIALYTKPTKGAPGITVTGDPVKAADGKEARPRVGANVRVQEEEETAHFFADTTGHVGFFDNKISVHAGFRVPEDVNYKTGNIDFVGDVEVAGTVASGFTVKAGGSVTIGGGVETGAKVEAGGDVVVSRGIVGPTITVKAGGDVLARFISNATVEAGGNVVVGGYVHNASVSAGGHVRVHGRGRLQRHTSAVVGERLLAVEGIRVASAGSRLGIQTQLIAGVDPRNLQRLQKVKAGIEFCNTNTVRILRTLRVTTVTPENLRQAVQNAPPEKRRAFELLVSKLQELAGHRRKFLDEQQQIRQRQDELLQHAVIRVDGVAFPGIRAQIGEVAAPVTTELEGVSFHLDLKEKKIVLGAVLESAE